MNNSSIFFIEQKSNKYDFDKFPEDLYVDTCVWNKAFKSTNKTFGYKYREFITNAIVNGTTVYSSPIVSNEISHITKEAIISSELGKYSIKKPRYSDGKINVKRLFELLKEKDPNITQKIGNEIDLIESSINELAEQLPFTYNTKFENAVEKVMKDSGYVIGSIDAQHIVLAHSYGINSIATADGDYWCLDNANLYVPNSEKYNIMRLGRKNVYLEFDKNKY